MKQLLMIFLFLTLFISIAYGQEIKVNDSIVKNEDTSLLPSYIYPSPSLELKDSNIIELPIQYKNKGITGNVFTCFFVDKKGQIIDYIIINMYLKDSLNNKLFHFYNENRINEYPQKVQIFYDLVLEKKKDIIITVNDDFVNYIKDGEMHFSVRFVFKDD